MTKDRPIGEKLRAMRRESGMTQAELARAVGVTQHSIAQWETGGRAPSMRHAVELSKVLGASPTEFLERVTTKRSIAAHVAAARDPRWVRVEERLPKKWQESDGETLVNYLIYSPDFGVDIGNFHAKAKRWLCMGIPSRVTHWMPMPSAPEE